MSRADTRLTDAAQRARATQRSRARSASSPYDRRRFSGRRPPSVAVHHREAVHPRCAILAVAVREDAIGLAGPDLQRDAAVGAFAAVVVGGERRALGILHDQVGVEIAGPQDDGDFTVASGA